MIETSAGWPSTVRAYQQGDFGVLNPRGAMAASEISLSRLLYRTLTFVSAAPGRSQLVPDAATDLGSPSKDCRYWTYQLRPGLRLQDGSLITAEVVKDSLQTRRDDHDVSAEVSNRWVDRIDVLGQYEIGFALKSRCVDWPYVLSQPGMSVSSRRSAGAAVGVNAPLSSGPYKIRAWRPGVDLKLDRNPFWSRDLDPVRDATPDGFTFEFAILGEEIDNRLIRDIGDDRTAIMLGSALEPITVQRLHKVQGAGRMVEGPTGCTRFLAINTQRIVDRSVRRALWAATDVENFRAARGLLTSTIMRTVIPPVVSGRVVQPDKPLGKVGLPGALNLAIPDTPSNRAGFAPVIAGYEKLGSKVTATYIPNSEYSQTLDAKREAFDIMLHGWCASYPDGGAVLPPLIRSDARANLSNFSDLAIDQQIDEVLTMPDTERRRHLWNHLDDRVMNEVPIIPMLASTAVALHGSQVENCVIHPSFGQIDLTRLSISSGGKVRGADA